MTWQAFAAAAPELARFAEEQFEQTRVALIGTIRRDGSPRISSVEPRILGGTLYLGMMWRSRKALDLLRDPRIVLRNAVCTNTGDEAELTLRGRATEVHDPEVRRRFAAAVAATTTGQEPRLHLFAIDIESAALVTYGRGEQAVKLWPQNVAFKRPYGW